VRLHGGELLKNVSQSLFFNSWCLMYSSATWRYVFGFLVLCCVESDAESNLRRTDVLGLIV
jgi:hypothetical protein